MSSGSTSGSSRPPTRTWSGWCGTVSFAPTSSSDCASSTSTCPLCAPAAPTSCSWPSTAWPSRGPATGSRACASPPRPRRSCSVTPGRATCGELRNTLEQTVLLARGELIEAGQIAFCRTLAPGESPSAPLDGTVLRLPESGVNLEHVERTLVAQALENTRWNVTRAARLLGLTRDTLRYRMEKYSFKSPS